MSTSTTVPIDQPIEISLQILAMANLVNHFNNLLEETLIPLANDLIAVGDTAQHDTEVGLDRAEHRMATLEESGIKQAGRTHATQLIKDYKTHMESHFKYIRLNNLYALERYPALKTGLAPDMFTKEQKQNALAVRDTGAYLYRLLEKANKAQADELLEKNEIWNEFLRTDEPEGFAVEFMERMAEWKKSNIDEKVETPTTAKKLLDDYAWLVKATDKYNLEETVKKYELDKDSTD